VKHIDTAASKFRRMHEKESLFVMPCAWDAFSALLFEQAGFLCIGTTSGGVNWVRGRKDYVYSTPKEEMLMAYGEIAHATSLPVSGDLENGYGMDPEEVADTIRKSISAGLVGGSIEDQQMVPTNDDFSNGSLYDLETSVARIAAARSAADKTGIEFTLTARCEVYYTESTNPYSIAVERLNAYREAGADCLFVPGLNKLDELVQLVKDVQGPISFGMGATPEPLTLSMLEDAGIRRVSTGGGITRALFSMIQDIAQEISTNGTFSYLRGALSETEINQALEKSRDNKNSKQTKFIETQ